MNPALLLIFLLLTPTQLREDKDFLEDEIDLISNRIVELSEKLTAQNKLISEADVKTANYFVEFKGYKNDLRNIEDKWGSHYDALLSKYNESKNQYNKSIDALESLEDEKKDILRELSEQNVLLVEKQKDLEKLEKIKPRKTYQNVSIVLSNTCVALIENNLPNNCPTYTELVKQYDNTLQHLSGEFVPTEFDIKRGVPQLQNHWKYYEYLPHWRIISVDPDAEFMTRSVVVEIQARSFITDSLFGNQKLEFIDGALPLYRDIKISDSCDRIITAPEPHKVNRAISYAMQNCNEEIDGNTVYAKFEKNTPLIRADFSWYKYQAWLQDALKSCIGLC